MTISFKAIFLITLILCFANTIGGVNSTSTSEAQALQLLDDFMAEMDNETQSLISFKVQEIFAKYTPLALKIKHESVSEETWRRTRLIVYHFYNGHYFDKQLAYEKTALIGTLLDGYNSAKACELLPNATEPRCYSLDPDLNALFVENRNYSRLSWAWRAYRDDIAKKLNLRDFTAVVDIQNKLAREMDASNFITFRRKVYFVDDFDGLVDEIYDKIEPLYKQVFAYTRRKLYDIYGKDYVSLQSPIPANLLGDNIGWFWFNILKDLLPYPESGDVEIQSSLLKKNFSARGMVEEADDFFASLGMERVPTSFWSKSRFVKPNTDDESVLCHAGAYDDGPDVYIRMCIDFTTMDFVIIHHEMGHIQYFLQYRNKTMLFRDGANPSFHEAIGDTISLSVLTYDHLKAEDLLSRDMTFDNGTDINFLMANVLWTIPSLPYARVMMDWQKGVYDGSIKVGKYNEEWWKLRLKFQGLIPPVRRSNDKKDYFAHFHNVYAFPYERYFFSFILSFQLYEGLCNVSGHVGPLHRCSFRNSKEAGRLLSEVLQRGSSRPWQDTLELISGRRSMSADSLLRYFQPLSDWLEVTNRQNGEIIDWNATDWRPKGWNGTPSCRSISFSNIFLGLLSGLLIRLCLIS